MKKMNIENMTLSNVLVAAAFLLIVTAAGYMPSWPPLSAGVQAAGIKTEQQPVGIPTMKGRHCSLTDFQRLINNIDNLRHGISTRKAAELAKYIWLAGDRFNCEPALIAALIQVESSFFSRATSHMGAVGLMQIRPFVARELARRLETSWSGIQTLHDPEINILMGTCYLATLLHDFTDLPTALVAYNCGPSYVRRRLRRGMRLPTRYPAKIISLYQTFAENRS
jgi:soluble lytic murein transglycosylase